MSKKLVCPNCGKTNMVSVECVWQHYLVSMNEDGDLEFDHLVREWTNDSEEPSIQCTSCGYDTSRESIVEHMKELKE